VLTAPDSSVDVGIRTTTTERDSNRITPSAEACCLSSRLESGYEEGCVRGDQEATADAAAFSVNGKAREREPSGFSCNSALAKGYGDSRPPAGALWFAVQRSGSQRNRGGWGLPGRPQSGLGGCQELATQAPIGSAAPSATPRAGSCRLAGDQATSDRGFITLRPPAEGGTVDLAVAEYMRGRYGFAPPRATILLRPLHPAPRFYAALCIYPLYKVLSLKQ